MVKVREMFVLCLVVTLFGGTAAAQSWQETIRYTKAPPDWDTYKKMREEAAWLIRAFADPVPVMNEDPAKFAVVLGRNDYELPVVKALNATALRQELSTIIAQKAEFDPIFEAVLAIARTSVSDRYVAMAEVKLLADCVRMYVKDYPAIAEPSREILLNYLADTRDEVRYIAVSPLALVKNALDSKKVTEALIIQLSDKNQAFIEASATALGDLGDPTAVRPLMTAFLSIKDDEDPMLTDEDTREGPPANGARLQIAIAVGKLTGIDRGLADLSGVKKSTLAEKYQELVTWWEANRGNYL